MHVSSGFGFERRIHVESGQTIGQIAERNLGGRDGIVAFIKAPPGSPQQWIVVAEEMWDRIKIKIADAIRFEVYQHGGNNVLRTIALIIVAIGAPYLAPALVPAGIAAAAVPAVTAAIQIGLTVAGTALVTSLFAPAGASQPPKVEERQEQAIADVDTDANQLAKGGRAPRVLGDRRISPVDICVPHRFLENGRQIVTRVLGLHGHHQISDIQIDGAAIDQMPDVESEVRDGSDGQAAVQLVTKITRFTDINEPLPVFSLQADSDLLSDQQTPDNAEPKEILFAPGYDSRMEEVTLRVGLSAFVDQTAATSQVRLPLRVAFWPKDNPTDIRRLPEIHIFGRRTIQVPKQIRFRWDDQFGDATVSKDYTYEFKTVVPPADNGLSSGATGDQWTCHPHFTDGTNEINIISNADGLNVTLDEQTFPKQEYEFSVIAGLPVINNEFSIGTYELNGVVHSLFESFGTTSDWKVPPDQDSVTAAASMQFATLVIDRLPVQTPLLATISLKTRDIGVKNVTCRAAAMVRDWDGSGWNTLGPSSNPSTHAYNVLTEAADHFKVSHDVVTSADFVGWRQECIDRNYTTSFVATGQQVNDIVDLMCTAGLATKRFDTGYGVDWFRDRTAELPVMTFSPRDSKISIEKVFAETPKGFMARFRNKDLGWRDDEIPINNNFGGMSFAANDIVDYPSIDDAKHLEERATFDMLQIVKRPKRWIVNTGPAGFNRKKGDLVSVVTDLESDDAHGFYIREVINALNIRLDRPIPHDQLGLLEDSPDLAAEPNLARMGLVSTLFFQGPLGVEEYGVNTWNDDVVTITSNFPPNWNVNGFFWRRDDIIGSRVTLAPRDKLFRRCIVLSAAKQSEQRSVLTLVDEAPEIYTELRTRFG